MSKKKLKFLDKNYDNTFMILNNIGNVLVYLTITIAILVMIVSGFKNYKEHREKVEEENRIALEEAEKKEAEEREIQEQVENQRKVKETNALMTLSEKKYRELLNENKLILNYKRELTNLTIELYSSENNKSIYRFINESKGFDQLLSFEALNLNVNLIGINELTDNIIKITDIVANKTIDIKIAGESFEFISENAVNYKLLLTDGVIDYSTMKDVNKSVEEVDIDAYLHDATEEGIIEILLGGDKKYRPILKDSEQRQTIKLIAEKHFNTFSFSLFLNKEEKEMVIYLTGETNGVELDRVIAYRFRNMYEQSYIVLGMKENVLLIHDQTNNVAIYLDLEKDNEPISIDYSAPNSIEGYESLL